MKGKKPKDLATKLLQGNKDRKRYQKSKVLPISMPRRPSGLPPRAKKFWNENAYLWYRLGKLHEYSVPIFEKICIIHGKIESLEKTIGENIEKLYEIEYQVDPSGTEHLKKKESIESKLLRLYYSQFRQYLKDAGVSPSEMRGLYEFVSREGDDNSESEEDEF